MEVPTSRGIDEGQRFFCLKRVVLSRCCVPQHGMGIGTTAGNMRSLQVAKSYCKGVRPAVQNHYGFHIRWVLTPLRLTHILLGEIIDAQGILVSPWKALSISLLDGS